MSTLVIAEMGSSSEGNIDLMRELIGAAAQAGASVAKNQWVSSAKPLCRRRTAWEYLTSYKKLEYPLEWHAELAAYAKSLGLEYACSVYLPDDPPLVAPFVDYLKISSFEALDDALVLDAMRAHQQVIVSTGMQDGYKDFRQWVDGTCYGPWAVLHCVSSYPAPLEALNLALVSGNGRADGEPRFAGFSDHSRDVRVGGWAVAAGASVIEAHIRLDETDPTNRDYAVSFAPVEFTQYVQNIRDAELTLGDGVKRCHSSEHSMARYQMKSFLKTNEPA